MYRRVPAGNALFKGDSDLLPGERRSIALVLSPEGFHQMFGCPSVTAFVRDTVGGGIRQGIIADIKNRDGNSGDATAKENADADAALNARLSSPDGISSLASQTPAPCGTGVLDFHVNPPDPFPGTDAHVREISVALEPGGVRVHFHADADVFCGSVDVSQDLHYHLSVHVGIVQISTPVKDSPSTGFSGSSFCKAALVAIATPIYSFVGDLAALFSFSILESIIAGIIGDKLLDIDVKPQTISPSLNTYIDWKDILCDTSGLRLNGALLGSVIDPQPFQPRLDIIVTKRTDVTIFVVPEPTSGETTKLTGVVCPIPAGTTLHFTRTVRDRQTTIAAKPHDLPLPITVGPWTVQFGYIYRSYGHEYGQYDAAIYPLVGGKLNVKTTAWDPEPLLDGTIVQNKNVTIFVTPTTDEMGFEIDTYRGDLNYVMKIQTSVIDAEGKTWNSQIYLTITGKIIDPGDDIKQLLADCARQFKS
jgi:hypothetical protein